MPTGCHESRCIVWKVCQWFFDPSTLRWPSGEWRFSHPASQEAPSSQPAETEIPDVPEAPDGAAHSGHQRGVK